MSGEIHKDDIGVKLRVTIVDDDDAAIDISAATTKQIVLKKPNGDILTKTASFEADGSDGIIYYTTISGDLDAIGTWKIQGIVIISSYTYHSSIESFKVHRNIS